MTRLTRRTLLQAGGAAAALGLMPRELMAQNAFPSADITVIVPYNAGGMSDNISRIVGERLTAMTGKNVLNEYKPGAGGALGANYYLGTKPDGHTILQSTNSFYGIIPNVTKVDYDPQKDFVPLCVIGFAPMVIAANPSLGVKSLAELVKAVKEDGKEVAYGSSGKGTVGHLCGEWLAAHTGIKMLHVPYKGATEALQACLGNEVQIFFGPESLEPIKAGSLNGLGVIGDAKAIAMPELQTTAEFGISGWAPRSWHTVTLLASVPEDIRQKWFEMLDTILAESAVIERIKMLGLYPERRSLADVRKLADEDFTQFGEMLRQFG